MGSRSDASDVALSANELVGLEKGMGVGCVVERNPESSISGNKSSQGPKLSACRVQTCGNDAKSGKVSKRSRC
jgi:hypothetical protein